MVNAKPLTDRDKLMLATVHNLFFLIIDTEEQLITTRTQFCNGVICSSFLSRVKETYFVCIAYYH